MPMKEEIIKTEADLLMNLLKTNKEIAISDAASQLGVPVGTVESWATFLEEEGLVSIKYKLTTPYLSYVEPDAKPLRAREGGQAFQENPELAKVQKDIMDLERLLRGVNDQMKNAQFSEVATTYPAIIEKIRALREMLSGIAQEDDQSRQGMQDDIRSLEELLERAKTLSNSKRYEIALQLYLEVYTKLRTVLIQVKELHEELLLSSMPVNPKADDIKNLLIKAYSHLKTNRYDDARRVYNKIKQAYYGLPGEYSEKKSEIEKDLVKLNKDLSSHIDRHSMFLMKKGSDRIAELIKKTYALLKQGDIQTAEDSYYLIRHLYKDLPDGFPIEKKKLQQAILTLFDSLSSKRRQDFSSRFASLSKEIRSELQEIRQAVEGSRLGYAIGIYTTVHQKYESLPPGFMNEKLAVQQEILEAYHLLSIAYQEQFLHDFKEKAVRMTQLLNMMEEYTRKGEVNLAKNAYEDINHLYTSLPNCFLKEKTELQNRMLRSYWAFIARSEKVFIREFTIRVNDINRMIDHAVGYLKKAEVDMADGMYGEIVASYNKLPPGFIKEKSELRQRILVLYKDVRLSSDVAVLKKWDERTNDKYRALLTLIVKTHQHIFHHEFNLVEPNLKFMKRLYSELPVGFVQQKTKLGSDIEKLEEEHALYARAVQFEDLTSNGMAKELSGGIQEVRRSAAQLSTQVAEDKPLFDYIEHLCIQAEQSLVRMRDGQSEHVSGSRAQLKAPLPPQGSAPPISSRPAVHREKRSIKVQKEIDDNFSLPALEVAKPEAAPPSAVQEDKRELQQKIIELKKRAMPAVKVIGTNAR